MSDRGILPTQPPRAIGTPRGAQAARNALYVYVRDHVFGSLPLDPVELARLVADAPAQLTLTKDEWWNVALALAMEVEKRAR